MISTLYVQQWALRNLTGGRLPERVRVTMVRASSRLFDAGFCSLPSRKPLRSVSNLLDQGNIALTDQFSPPILCSAHHLRRAILNPLGLASERMGFSTRTGI